MTLPPLTYTFAQLSQVALEWFFAYGLLTWPQSCTYFPSHWMNFLSWMKNFFEHRKKINKHLCKVIVEWSKSLTASLPMLSNHPHRPRQLLPVPGPTFSVLLICIHLSKVIAFALLLACDVEIKNTWLRIVPQSRHSWYDGSRIF